MRRVMVADWLELERAGLLADGQIREERATEAAVLLLSRCAGLSQDDVLALPVAELWRQVREALDPFPGAAQGT